MVGFPALFSLFLAAAPAPTPTSALDADVGETQIYGGSPVATCGWPTTVSMQGSCTGTLVHPQVVIYAAHCGSGYSSVTFGETINGSRTVPTQFCRTYPGGGPGNGTDFAFCVLAEPQDDIEIVPPLMGCETSVLTPGREVVIVGFGQNDNGGYGVKYEVTTQLNGIQNNEASIGGGGKDSCQGDSGGPVFVRLPESDGADGSWRVFGITSYGGQCGGGGMYSMMHIGMQWFEQESGFDLTPCHDAEGNWTPTPECGQFPLEPGTAGGSWAEGCNPGPLTGFSSVCGAAFDPSNDKDPPVVAFVNPQDGERLESTPGKNGAEIDIEITADDGDGYGVATVELLIDDQSIPGGVLQSGPYVYPALLPPGTYSLRAVATDLSGNVGEAGPIYIGVDMDPVLPEEDGSSSSGGDGDEPMGTSDTGDSIPDTDTGPGQTDDAANGGCACRATSPSPRLGWLLLLGWVARRRRAA